MNLYKNSPYFGRQMARVVSRTSQNTVSTQSDFLMHYGISGQKWGIRRFEDYDGTLTPEGKKRYRGGLHKEEDVRRDFDNYVSRNSGEVSRIKEMSVGVRKVQADRDRAYKEYCSNYKISDKGKKQLEKVIDSWYGTKVDDEMRELYNYEVREVMLSELMDNRPDNIRKLDSKYREATKNYWEAVDNFTSKIVNEYSQTKVYTTKRGFLGIPVIDQTTDGEVFINKLISENNLLVTLGGMYKSGSGYASIGGAKYSSTKADEMIDSTASKLAKQFDVNWYNKQKSKQL